MKTEDFVGPPCDCPDCRQAGVTDLNTKRDPWTGKWLHGYDLKRLYEAQQKFLREARAAVGRPGRHAQGFERVAKKP
jgi:hypothetical protein